MYKLIISLRYLQGRLITMCSIAFVAIGVMALIVVNSVMTGFQKEFKSRLRGTLSHMTVSVNPEDIDRYREIVRTTPHVAHTARRKEGLVLLAWQGKVQGCKVLGIEPQDEYQVSELERYLMTPYRELHAQLGRAAEQRSYDFRWELQGVTRDAQQRRVAWYNEVREITPSEPDSRQIKPTPRPAGLVFDDDDDGKVVFLQQISRLRGEDFPAIERAGDDFDRAQAWFDGFNAELANDDVDLVIERFSKHMLRNTAYLDPRQPFKLPGSLGEQQTEPGILVGHELFLAYGMRIGTTVELITARTADEGDGPRDGRTPDEDQLEKKGRIFVVTGSFKTGMNEYDSSYLYTPYGATTDFLDADRGNIIGVRLDDFDHAEVVRDQLIRQLRRGYVETWKDKRRNLLRAVDMERAVMFVIMFFFILFAVVTIAVILILLVVEKYRDIGILKSMGATSWGVASIFVTNGMVAGVIGCLLGVTSGVAIASNVNEISDSVYAWTGFRVFPKDVYYLDKIPSDVDPVWIGYTVMITMALCLLCCLVPAFRAGRLQVVDTLKWE